MADGIRLYAAGVLNVSDNPITPFIEGATEVTCSEFGSAIVERL